MYCVHTRVQVCIHGGVRTCPCVVRKADSWPGVQSVSCHACMYGVHIYRYMGVPVCICMLPVQLSSWAHSRNSSEAQGTPPRPVPAARTGSRTRSPRASRAALPSRAPEGAREAAAPPGAGRPLLSSSPLCGRRSGRPLGGWPPRWAVAIVPPPPPSGGLGADPPARPGPAALSGTGLPKEAR